MAGLPTLYSFRRCPYAMRARLALAVSGSQVVLREVALRDKPNALVAASSKATVPVLVLADGTVIDESLEIMSWALTCSDPQAWLGHDQAEIYDQIAACDGPFKAALDRCKYPERFPVAEGDEAWTTAQRLLQCWEQRLGHAHLCGSRRSLADAAIFPFVRQFAAISHERWAALPLPRLQAWLRVWLASDLFAAVMEKHQPWREGDVPVRFPATVPAGPQMGA